VVDDAVVHMIDHKPKTTLRLQRLINVETTPRGSLLVDSYDEEWAGLWWVRVDGPASVASGGEVWERAQSALVDKYRQYGQTPPTGPAIVLTMDLVTHWVGS
jgi:PPOX class probable F420-dependent enzyme